MHKLHGFGFNLSVHKYFYDMWFKSYESLKICWNFRKIGEKSGQNWGKIGVESVQDGENLIFSGFFKLFSLF